MFVGFVFGGLDFSRRDLMAVNIQRGRDHGLPDYNTARKYLNLDPITKWTDINPTRCGKAEDVDLTNDEASEDCKVNERFHVVCSCRANLLQLIFVLNATI